MTSKAATKGRRKPRGVASPTSPHRTRGGDNRAKVLELRKAGHSFPAIGKKLKLSTSTVFEHFKNAMAELQAVTLDDATEVRRLECERLDKYLLALEPKVKRGDTEAVQAALRCHTARARLFGLIQNAVELRGAPGAPVGLQIYLPAEEPAAPATSPQDAPAAAGDAGGGVAAGGAPAGAVEASKP